MNPTLTELQEKIRKVVPNVDWTENLCTECDGTKCNGLVRHVRPITLADVLRAIGETKGSEYALMCTNGAEYGEFMRRPFGEKEWQYLSIFWNLPHSLEDQEPPLWDFLNTIIK